MQYVTQAQMVCRLPTNGLQVHHGPLNSVTLLGIVVKHTSVNFVPTDVIQL